MIRTITLENFKAFRDLKVSFRPITVLIGPDNVGKSSILAALRLLGQTTTSYDPSVPLLLQGPLGDFGTYRDVVHGNHRGRPFHIALEVDEYGNRYFLNLEYKYRTVRRELILREATLETGKRRRRHLITISYSEDSQRHLITRLGAKSVPIPYRGTMAGSLLLFHFLPRVYFRPRTRGKGQERALFAELFSPSESERLSIEINTAAGALENNLQSVDYIGSMRTPPERNYQHTGEATSRIGSQGENWAGHLVLDLNRPARSRTIEVPLHDWMKKAGLASDVRPKWSSDRTYEIQVQHPKSREYENLADVGQANSQVLPVLVGGLRLPADSTYIVEEPEIHLHPRAQAELGDFFLYLYERGVQALVETHSEYLLLRLQQHVARGAIPPEAIIFYYVSARGTRKVVRQLSLDRQGRFVQPIPHGFYPERLEEAKKLARLRAARE